MNGPLNHASLLLLSTLVLTSCRKDRTDDPVPPNVNEEEVITTLSMHFHSTGDAEHKHFEFFDADGDGGLDPVINADTLSGDSVYEVSLELLNATVSPPDDITAEIQDESDVHQFFFQVSGANAMFTYADADVNGLPLGLETICTVGAASTGVLTVILRHGPDKTAPGVSSGDITNAGGETDIEVTFPLIVE